MSEIAAEFSGAKILVVDDVPTNLDVLIGALQSAGYVVLVATDGVSALRVADQEAPDLVLLDVAMPEMDGYEVCRRLHAIPRTREIPVIFVTAAGDTEQIVTGFRNGAVDYIVKPFRFEEVIARIRTQLERIHLAAALRNKNDELVTANAELRESYQKAAETNRRLEAEISRSTALDSRLHMISKREEERWGIEGFVGDSPTVRNILRDVGMLHNASAMSVMITGESGTGKELIARAIHAGSDRRDQGFVAVNCATIADDLAESLLFGHKRGAFTGAATDQVGYFELADEGTLFLDEIGTMPVSVQAKLLRTLEDGMIRPLGSREDRHVNVRILAATNAPLSELREDLYFRLARYTVDVPPLRQRKEDIPLLARHFLNIFAHEMGMDLPELTAAGLDQLMGHGFPGNVRELKNIVERALIESGGATIEPRHLYMMPISASLEAPVAISAEEPSAKLAAVEAAAIQRAIAQTHGNKSEAARLLGINRNKLYRLLGKQPAN